MKDQNREKVFRSLPAWIATELIRLASVRGGASCISEIKLRAVGVSVAVISGERVRLLGRVKKNDLKHTLEVLCDGALYSHRDTVGRGYISLPSGIRVGVCGSARYDGGRLVGISDVTSLVFRIPTGSFDARCELLSVFSSAQRGVLIFSPPGRGKTTALRGLVKDIGMIGEEVAVIDERCEFIDSDYSDSSVDILRGYTRAEGIEIALRTLSPSVIAVDEIGRLSEAESMIEALSSGVRVAVTAHAGSVKEILSRIALRPLFSSAIVDKLVGIEIAEGKRRLSVTEV